MTKLRYLTRVPVGMLRYGLYVAELDRPWQEVPVKFQGFEIRSAEELDILRQHCDFVYVEDERSKAEAYAALEAEIRQPQTEGQAQPGEADISAVLGQERYPDKRRFAQRLQAAVTSRLRARAYLERLLQEARLGRSLDSEQARAVVEDLASQVSSNASAMMWLTHLKKKNETISTHSLNVGVLSLAFGMYLGLRGEHLHNVGIGALLHDIGKLNQPAELLAKTGSLSAAERELVSRHPQDGYELIRQSGGVPPEALDIIRMHHERLDGTGFPQGLHGGDIPLHARIVALVNRYDAFTTDRPERAARPADEVLQELYNDRGQSYGAALVQDFIHCVGIFPLGSLVELDNGALGIVMGSSPESRLKPTVLLVRTPEGQHYGKRLLLNLAAEPEDQEGRPARHIRRVVNPADYAVDVPATVAFEFGIYW